MCVLGPFFQPFCKSVDTVSPLVDIYNVWLDAVNTYDYKDMGYDYRMT